MATRRNKDGTRAVPAAGPQRVGPGHEDRRGRRCCYTFGREDQLDRDAIKRLVASLSRLLDPADALAVDRRPAELAFIASRPFGGTYVLDALWRRLRHRHRSMARLLQPGAAGAGPDATERVLFALVANRALAPSSKLAAAGLDHPRRAHRRPGRDRRRRLLPGDGLAARGRATTWSSRCSTRSPTCSTSRSTCCSSTPPPPTSRLDEADEPVARDEHGRRPDPTSEHRRPATATHGGRRPGSGPTASPRTHRDDLPQIVIGMAVTRDGIPVRVWCWPGNTADSALIRQVKDDMRDWTLAQDRVGRRPRASPPRRNRRYLRRGEHALHHRREAALRLPGGQGRPVPAGPLPSIVRTTCGSRKSRIADDRTVRDLLQPRGSRTRRRTSATSSSPSSTDLIADTDTAAARPNAAELRGEISTKPGLNRYLRATPGGLLRIDTGQDQDRGEPGRQVPAALLRPAPVRRGHRPGLQATPAKSNAAGGT